MLRTNNFRQLICSNASCLLAHTGSQFGSTSAVHHGRCLEGLRNPPPSFQVYQDCVTTFAPALTPGFVSTRFFTAEAMRPQPKLETPAPEHQAAGGHTTALPPTVILYKGCGMRIFRVLVRMKIFQLTGVAALAIPITTFLSQGAVSPMQTMIASALLIGSGAASTALWYYSRRYVGELALLRDVQGQPLAARFSVLDFWGNRENNDVPLADIVPPLQGVLPPVRAVMLREALIPMDVEGDRQYFLSLRYGYLLDKPLLLALLEGRLGQQGEQQQQQQQQQVDELGEQRQQLGRAGLPDR